MLAGPFAHLRFFDVAPVDDDSRLTAAAWVGRSERRLLPTAVTEIFTKRSAGLPRESAIH